MSFQVKLLKVHLAVFVSWKQKTMGRKGKTFYENRSILSVFYFITFPFLQITLYNVEGFFSLFLCIFITPSFIDTSSTLVVMKIKLELP